MIIHSKREDLIRIAKERKLVLQENYMFQFHKQLEVVKDIISLHIHNVKLGVKVYIIYLYFHH